MCNGEDSLGKECYKKENCYRYLIKLEYMQTYCIIEDIDKCNMFWEFKKNKTKTVLSCAKRKKHEEIIKVL